jgi:hypothetical protein
MTKEQASGRCSCTCGRVAATVTGKPILHAMCYCSSCRTAGLAFAQEPGAPSVIGSDGGTDLLLYRKDRIARFEGGELLREHRLTPTSPTRRLVATCCNTPMFLEFTRGHWLSIYADRVPENVTPLEVRIMTGDRVDKMPLPNDVPSFATHSAKAMMKLLVAWAAMGFRKPKVVW